jgi:uncharacterized protein YdeI (YjbR/CyaY-like superfamily)
MPNKSPPSDLPTVSFSNATDFESFLEEEHAISAGCYLKLAKKSSGIQSVTAAEAVEVALCFGWIDGRANGLDENWFLIRYTPRRPKSLWSQKNVNTVTRLENEGRIRPAGRAAVEAAKADGRWERAYEGSATITVPKDLTAVLAANPVAAVFFEGMSRSDRYAVLWRVETAAPQNRAKRIESLVQILAAGKRPGSQEKLVTKSKKSAGVQKAISKTAARNKQSTSEEESKSTLILADSQARQPRREGLRPRS